MLCDVVYLHCIHREATRFPFFITLFQPEKVMSEEKFERLEEILGLLRVHFNRLKVFFILGE